MIFLYYDFFDFRTRNATAVAAKSRKNIDTLTNDFTINFWNSLDGRMRLLRVLFDVLTIDAKGVNNSYIRGGIKLLWYPKSMNEELIKFVILIKNFILV